MAVEHDPQTLNAPAGKLLIAVEALDGGETRFVLRLAEMDPALKSPGMWGVMISDLIDHIAAAYGHFSPPLVSAARHDILRGLKD
jgi:hypothetical protein